MLNPLTLAKLPECPISIEKLFSWLKLLGTTIKVFEACDRFCNKITSISHLKPRSLVYLIKVMQQSFYSEQLTYLLLEGAARARRTPPSLVHNLNLYIGADGLVRSAGRVDNNPLLSHDAKNPLLAHKGSHITTLLIRNAHHQGGHMGLYYIKFVLALVIIALFTVLLLLYHCIYDLFVLTFEVSENLK